MRRVGLLGGTGWPSTRDYYDELNRRARARRGRLHGLPLLVWSFDLQTLLDDEATIGSCFGAAADGLRDAGAELLAIASNTGHRYQAEVEGAGLPLVHLGDVCIDALRGAGVRRFGVLATRRAVDGGVFGPRFAAAGLEPVLPADPVAEAIDTAIFAELEGDQVGPLTRQALAAAWADFASRGIGDVLLGCTEIRPRVLRQALGDRAGELRAWDSTALHCDAIVARALED